MGRLRAMSVAKPRNSPRESKLDLQVKFIEEPDLNVERNRRSKSVSFDSFEQSNRIYEIRQRKAPVRFEPENFIRKTREAKLRRSSTPITLSPPKFEFVSVQNDIVQPKSKKLKPPAVRKADKILEETGEISRSRSKKLTHHKQIETAQFLLSSFPGSFNFARNKKGKHLSLFKYDKTGGILHMTPNTKKEIRQVENERELIFFVVSGTLEIIICSGSASKTRTRKLTLTTFGYIKLKGGVMYKIENNEDEPLICIFNSCKT